MTEATAPQHTFLGRMLDTIERVGNKVPHPAIIFIILIAGVIVLSQILYIAGASVTYEVVVPPTVEAEQGYPAGSAVEVPNVPVEDFDIEDMHIETETTAVQGLLTRRRDPLHDHLAGRQLQQFRGGRDHPRGHARRRAWPKRPGSSGR